MIPNFEKLHNTREPMSKAMSAEQFEQIVTAILDGKYSWACVLILRFAGYNPAHYIPYRTYKRLIKDNKRTQKVAHPLQSSVNTLANPFSHSTHN